MPVLRFAALLFFLSAPLLATPSPDCSFEALTDRCALFDPVKENRLTFPDGVVLPKFAATPGSASRKPAGDWGKRVQIRLEVAKLLEEVDVTKMHPLFKLYVTEHLGQCLPALFPPPAVKNGAAMTVIVPWPPEAPRDPSAVNRSEFRKTFFGLLTSPQLERLQPLAQAVRAEEEALPGDTALTAERQAYVAKLLSFVRDRLVELVRRGRPTARLSEMEKSAIARLQAIQTPEPAQDLSVLAKACQGELPRAFYSASDHGLHLCPALYQYPDTALVSVVAHEMAHAIDPCHSQFGMYFLQRDKLADWEKAKEVPAPLARFLDDVSARSSLTAAPISLFASPAVQHDLESRGVVVLQATGTPFSHYLFKDVYDCLKSASDPAFRPFGQKEASSFFAQIGARRRQYRGPAYLATADEKRLSRILADHPECVGGDEHSPLSEAVADWMASRVLADFLQGVKLKTVAERVAPIGYFADLICRDRYRARADQVAGPDPLSSAGADYPNPFLSIAGSKPRLERIFLTENHLRAALGCALSSAKTCEHKVP